MDPPIHYATTADGIGIAYWTLGEGQVLVVPPTLPSSHIELEWQVPGRRAAFEGLAHGARVVRYDCRGMGMSQRDKIDFSVEAAIKDLDAVVDRLEVEKFAILRIPSSGSLPFAYAATHPDRVSHLLQLFLRSVEPISAPNAMNDPASAFEHKRVVPERVSGRMARAKRGR